MHPDTASSDLYERFEAMCAEVERDGFVDRDFRPYVPPRGPGTVPPRPPTKSIEVAALFDARVQMGDQRGRRGKAVWSDKSAPPKKGPLRCLFDDYAARDDVYDLDDTNDKPSLMSRAEAFQLAHDFDIVPGLLRRRDVAMAFANADRPAYGDDAADNRENQLDFDEFVSFVCQMATLAWHRPAGANERKTGKDKDGSSSSSSSGRGRGEEGGRGASLDDVRAVDAMLRKLQCDSSDVAELKRRLAVYARRQIYNPRDLDAYPRYDKYAHVDAVSSVRPHAAAIERVNSGAPVPSEMIERATRRGFATRGPAALDALQERGDRRRNLTPRPDSQVQDHDQEQEPAGERRGPRGVPRVSRGGGSVHRGRFGAGDEQVRRGGGRIGHGGRVARVRGDHRQAAGDEGVPDAGG